MIEVIAVDRSGDTHHVAADAEQTLMQALREASLGVAAVCGGMASCGTCHVYVDDAGECCGLPPAGDDEQAMTEALSHHVNGTSRLSCQIPLRGLTGRLRVTLAPEE